MEGDGQSAIGCSSGSPGMPVWFAKSHSRYDEQDDIQFSLPSGDDGFFSLHFGNSDESPQDVSVHKSTFDRINEELGFSKVGSSGVSLGVSPSKGSGLCLTAELQQYSLREEVEPSAYSKPLDKQVVPIPVRKAPAIVTPPTFIIGGDDGDNAGTTSAIAARDLTADGRQINAPDFELAENLHRRLSDVAEHGNLGIFTKIKKYFLNTEPSSPINVSPHHSPKPLRKTSTPVGPLDITALDANNQTVDQPKPETQFHSTGGIVAERKMNYNAFFYRPESEQLKDKAQKPKSGADGQASDNKQNASGAGDSSSTQTSGSKGYRPKPSQLREMNFWAPTSM